MPTDIKSIAHPYEEAADLAAKSLALLQAHRTPACPLPYALIYAYLGGVSAELAQALGPLLQGNRPLDEALLRDLFDRFLASDRNGCLRGMGNDLQALLVDLISHLNTANVDARAFGAALAQGLQSLDVDAGIEQVRRVVRQLADATVAAAQRNQNLQGQLESTLAETEHLRVELEEHRRAALMDPLTGLLNRRGMDARLEALLAPAPPAEFSLLMIDIDHFKSINDHFGHALGDAVIRNVADAIRKCIRGGDHAVRYGGEEFLVILPDTPVDGASTVAETVRARVASLRLVRRRDDFRLPPFTVSVGVAGYQPGDNADALLQRADSALYRSKEQGRNRVSVQA